MSNDDTISINSLYSVAPTQPGTLMFVHEPLRTVPQPSTPIYEIFEGEKLLEHRERQIEALHAMAAALFARHTVDELVREVLRVAIEVMHAEVGSIQLYDPTADTLIFRYVIDPAAQQLVGHSISASQGIAGAVFRSGKGQITLRVQEHEDFNPTVDELTGYKTHSMLTAALKRREATPIGVVQILNGRRAFDELDLEVLEVLCAYAASSIETAALQEEARKAQMVSLIGDIAHDIKNMMTPVQTGIWAIRSTVNKGQTNLDAANRMNWQHQIEKYNYETQANLRAILQVMMSACEKVQSRTGQIADAIKGQNTVPVFADTDLNGTIGEVVGALGLVANASDMTLDLELFQELPPIQADSRQLYNAIYNLVINAISATPKGGRVVVRSGIVQPEAGQGSQISRVWIEVEDNGRGMSDDIRQRLFTDSVVSTKPGGTGLGTRIVANVVRLHQGDIQVESEVGQGSRFYITLPLRPIP